MIQSSASVQTDLEAAANRTVPPAQQYMDSQISAPGDIFPKCQPGVTIIVTPSRNFGGLEPCCARERPKSMRTTVLKTAAAAGLLLMGACAANGEVAVSSERISTTTTSEGVVPSDTWGKTIADLDVNRELWESRKSETYEMTYQSRCGENGWITEGDVTIAVTGEEIVLIAGTLPLEVATVDRLFAVIADTQNAETVEVAYGEYGQPMNINIDYSSNSIDDEFCVVVSEFDLTSE